MNQDMEIKDFDNVSFDTVSDNHVFSLRFEKRQRELIEKVKKEERNRYKESMKKWKVAVAALVLVIGIPGVVGAAAGLFKVENMIINKEDTTKEQFIVGDTETFSDKENLQKRTKETTTEQQNILVLAVPESPEWKAQQEWFQYCTFYERSYQYEEGILMEDELFKQGDTEGRFSGSMENYGVYTLDMAEKLNELCEKYNLQLLGERVYYESYEEAMENLGVESFIADGYQLDSVNFRAFKGSNWGGSFDLLDDNEKVLSKDVSVSVNKQGFLDNYPMNMGDLSNFDEWNYTNQNGEVVDVVMNYKEEYCYIFYKGEKDFAVVHVEPEYTYYRDDVEVDASTTDWWTHYETTMPTKEQVQKIADAFVFSNVAE